MKETLKIDGMTCDHCVMHVTNALESVEKAKVSLKKKEALVKFDAPANLDQMALAVAEAGYKVI